MRKYVYGCTLAAMALLVAGAMINSQPIQIANAAQASGIVDIRAIEATIDIKALPVLNFDGIV